MKRVLSLFAIFLMFAAVVLLAVNPLLGLAALVGALWTVGYVNDPRREYRAVDDLFTLLTGIMLVCAVIGAVDWIVDSFR